MKALERVIECFRRRRLLLVALAVCVALVAAWYVNGALDDSEQRRASRDRIEANTAETARLTAQVQAQQADIARILKAIESATSDDARARSSAVLGFAIAELRRSIDCANLYALGHRPPACAEVAGRLDELVAGGDPFAGPQVPIPQPTPATQGDD